MDKQHILAEIRRTGRENGGVPLGHARFFQETGIRQADWFGKYWSRWGDAVREAGFAPNKLQEGFDEEELIQKYIGLIRELGRIPVLGELRLKKRKEPSFPNDKTLDRFGSKSQLITKVLEYCRDRTGFDDVIHICADNGPSSVHPPRLRKNEAEIIGSVYMLKSGRYYKIGRTGAVGRREYELGIQLPTKARTVHVIRTDDPPGIENYWHTRFAAKRANGEWFELDASDIQAFTRRKFM